MGISPEDRRRIYEEEKARIEAEEKANGSTTSLKPHVAGLLCYLGIWVSGIIFLIIERRNRRVRFHAMQSLVTFGILHIIIAIAHMIRNLSLWQAGVSWDWFFYPQSIAANIVAIVFTVIAVVLWIILMYQSYHGRVLKLAGFGDLAEKLLAKLDGEATLTDEEPAPAEPEAPPSTKTPPPKRHGFDSHFEGTPAGRLAASIAAIVWSTILLVFFNFFSRYFAVYSRVTIDGSTFWQRYPLFTSDLSQVMLILNITLILTIVGHGVIIALRRYLVRQIVLIILNTLGMATALTFIRVFPFDFSVVPHAGAAAALPTVTLVILILITIGLGISAIVRFVRLMIYVARKRGEAAGLHQDRN